MAGNYPAGVTDNHPYFTDETECDHRWSYGDLPCDDPRVLGDHCLKCGELCHDKPCFHCEGTLNHHIYSCKIHPCRTREGAEIAI